MTLGPIYKVNGEVTGARIKEPENWMYNGAVASIVGGSLTEGEMYNFYITSDVMAIYHDPGG